MEGNAGMERKEKEKKLQEIKVLVNAKTFWTSPEPKPDAIDRYEQVAQSMPGGLPGRFSDQQNLVEQVRKTVFENEVVFMLEQQHRPTSWDETDLSKAQRTKIRAWKIIDLVHKSRTVLSATVSDFLVHGNDFFRSLAPVFGERTMDVRLFLVLLLEEKVRMNFVDAYTEDDLNELWMMAQNPGSRFRSILDHPNILTMDENENFRRDTSMLSAAFVADMQFFESLEKDFSVYHVWNSMVEIMSTELPQPAPDSVEDSKTTFLDIFAWQTLLHFTMNDGANKVLSWTSPEFVEFMEAYPAQSKFNHLTRKKLEGLTLQMRMRRNISTWQFYGKKRKHYEYRRINIFDVEARRVHTATRVNNRLVSAYNLVQSPLAFGVLLKELATSTGMLRQGTVDAFEKWLREEGAEVDFLELTSNELWVIDTAIEMLVGEERLDDGSEVVLTPPEESTSSTVNLTSSRWSEEDRQLVLEGDELKRNYFDYFDNYSPETFKMLEEMAMQARDNVVFAFYDLAYAQSLDICTRSEEDERLLDELERFEQLTPWLHNYRFSIRERQQFDEYWKEIKEVSRLDNLPWLFYNDWTGEMEDPSIEGASYGPPGSDEYRSELRRRQLGIPSMYWYGSNGNRVRYMEPYDLRRLEGTDGSLLYPPLELPKNATKEDRDKWNRSWDEYEAFVDGLTKPKLLRLMSHQRPEDKRLMRRSTREGYDRKLPKDYFKRMKRIRKHVRSIARERKVVLRKPPVQSVSDYEAVTHLNWLWRTMKRWKKPSDPKEAEYTPQEKQEMDELEKFRLEQYRMYDQVRDDDYVMQQSGGPYQKMVRVNVQMDFYEREEDIRSQLWIRERSRGPEASSNYTPFEWASRLRWEYLKGREERARADDAARVSGIDVSSSPWVDAGLCRRMGSVLL